MYNTIDYDGNTYDVKYSADKAFVYATVFIGGKEIKTHGDDKETAYWDLSQKIYQALDLPKSMTEVDDNK